MAGADALHPRLTRGFLKYSQHRGFITDAARVCRPRDKLMVERSVQYARERFFKGEDFRDLAQLREKAARWCRDVPGMRIHGTTRRQPLQVFLDEERQALLPWNGEPYEVTHWRTAKVHTDHHVACQYVPYSLSSTLCPPGQQVEVGPGVKLVRIFNRGQPVKVHPRRPRGGCSTDNADYPAELSAYTLRAPDGIKHTAAEQGPAIAEFAYRLFDGPLPWSRIRQGLKPIRLGQRYTSQRLDAVCRRALEVYLVDVGRVERILVQSLDQQETPEYPPSLLPGRFARPGGVFAHGKAHIMKSTESTESAELKTGGQP
ncbi:MAG: transposase [Chloroflexi bacterium]|nr:transposase [Chloroflexota bacterium]